MHSVQMELEFLAVEIEFHNRLEFHMVYWNFLLYNVILGCENGISSCRLKLHIVYWNFIRLRLITCAHDFNVTVHSEFQALILTFLLFKSKLIFVQNVIFGHIC